MAGRSHPHSGRALFWLVTVWWLLLGLPASAVVPPARAMRAPASEAACPEPEAVHVTAIGRLRIAVVLDGGRWFGGTDAVAIARYELVVPPQTTNFTHDGAGNRTGDAKHAYTWDPRGRMTTLSRHTSYAAVNGGPVNVTYIYDARGRRIMKTVQDTVLVGATTTNRTTVTKWVYDGWLPVVEETQIDAGPIKRKFFVWGLDLSQTVGGAGGIGGLIAIHDVADNPSNSKTYLPVTDGLGNIVALLDSASKATLAKWTYDAWGNTVSSEGNTALCPFGWQSKYRDPESGLIYFGYRYYDPPTRRWLSRDPLGENGSFNLYSYCRENPVGRIDAVGAATLSVLDDLFYTNDLQAPRRPAFSAADIAGIHHPFGATFLRYGGLDPSVFDFTPVLAPPMGERFDFFSEEIEAIAEPILRQFAEDYGKYTRHETGWFDKPLFSQYDPVGARKKALCSLGEAVAPLFPNMADRRAFLSDAEVQLRLMEAWIPREIDPNTWFHSGVLLLDYTIEAALLIGTDGMGAAARTASRGGVAAAKKPNLNSNDATSNFGLYEIETPVGLDKVGKADLNRVTQSSGLPTRLHQQVRKLEQVHGQGNVKGTVVEDLGETTTAAAKAAENARIKRIVDETGQVPPGNAKSYKQ